MAAAARLLRLGISTCPRLLSERSHAARVPCRALGARLKTTSSMGRGAVKRDEEFITPYQSFEEKREEDVEEEFAKFTEKMSTEEKEKLEKEGDHYIEYLNGVKGLKAASEEIEEMFRKENRAMTRKVRMDFWNEDEPEDEEVTDGLGEDDFDGNDITSMAHDELDEHKEKRQYARYAVWEMPLLAQWAKPFEAPTQDQVLRFRYTTYMGEWHPGSNKVVLEFAPRDLPLSDAEQLKLKKLVGPRYNPERDMVKMSCDMFDNQAQNKRYLGDMVDKLMAEAKDHTDMFEDVALDLRHHKFRRKLRFPEDWKMTDERRKMLVDLRTQQKQLDDGKQADGLLIDGPTMIKEAQGQKRAPKEGQAVPVPARGPVRREVRRPEARTRG